MIIDSLIEKSILLKNPTCVGLDTCVDYLPEDMQKKCVDFESVGNYIFEFNKNIIDNIKDLVPAVKVQVAYYEMYGYHGIKAFEKTLNYAKEKNLIVISDIKRNDIGSTAEAYSKAYLSGVKINNKNMVAFNSDFITVNGYLGSDGIKPFVNDCKMSDKGLFVLVKTSNPTSEELQDKKFESGLTLYQEMARLTKNWGKDLIGKHGFSSIGAVVGATKSKQAKILREQNESLFFLIPGYGAQGATAKDLAVSFIDGKGGIVNSSRGIICAYQKNEYFGQSYFEASRNAVIAMQKDLEKNIY